MVPTFAASPAGIPAMAEGIKRWTRSTRLVRTTHETWEALEDLAGKAGFDLDTFLTVVLIERSDKNP